MAVCILGILGAASTAQAVLLITFEEKASGVLLTCTGTIDTTGAAFVSDAVGGTRINAGKWDYRIILGTYNYQPEDNIVEERLSMNSSTVLGTQIFGRTLIGDFNLTNGVGIRIGGGDFKRLRLFDPQSNGLLADDDQAFEGVVASEWTLFYSNETFTSMNFTVHPFNTVVEYANVGSNNDSINIIFVPIPESSSTALLGLGGLSLLLRRKRV